MSNAPARPPQARPNPTLPPLPGGAQLWGLTGGIASGKSTVARLLRGHGAAVVDADAVYHGLLAPAADGQPSPLGVALGSAFPGSLTVNGEVDRRRLGGLVFTDAAARARLEALTHPAVAAASRAQIWAHADAGQRHIFYDVPLLYERGLAETVAGVLLVWLPRPLQLDRLMQRGGLTTEAAEVRLAAQWPLDHKRSLARWCIDNSGGPAATAVQVAQIWTEMQHLPPAA